MDYRCRCGNRRGFGSMPFAACDVCEDCGSTMATSPDTHAEPEPHNLVTRYHAQTGKSYRLCLACHYRDGREEACGP